MALGDGGEFRAPMAIAVIGGLLVSTVLSLVFVPAFFMIMDDLVALLLLRSSAASSARPTSRPRKPRGTRKRRKADRNASRPSQIPSLPHALRSRQ